jgi:uncharacterized membrane protein YvlD (DUF360 family)
MIQGAFTTVVAAILISLFSAVINRILTNAASDQPRRRA